MLEFNISNEEHKKILETREQRTLEGVGYHKNTPLGWLMDEILEFLDSGQEWE